MTCNPKHRCFAKLRVSRKARGSRIYPSRWLIGRRVTGGVAGQRERPRARLGVAVRAAAARRRRPGAGGGVATLLPQGVLRAVGGHGARPGRHQPHLRADHARRDARRVQLRHGEAPGPAAVVTTCGGNNSGEHTPCVHHYVIIRENSSANLLM